MCQGLPLGDFARTLGCWAVTFLCEPVLATPLSGDRQRLGVSSRPPELLRSPRPRPTACCEESGWGFDSSPPRPPTTTLPANTRGANFQAHCHPGKVLKPEALNQSLPSRRVEGALGSERVADVTTLSQVHLDSRDSPTWRGRGPRGILRPDRSLFFPRPFPSHWVA